MAKGFFVSTEFHNGCKFEIDWEQVQHPEELNSTVNFDVWFYNPTDSKVVLCDPYIEIDLRSSGIVYDRLIKFGKIEHNLGHRFEIIGRGYHRLADYIPAGNWYINSITIPHYSSGLPKASYTVNTGNMGLNSIGRPIIEVSGEKVGYTCRFTDGTINLDPMEIYDPGEDFEETVKKPSTAICANTYIGDYANITITANEKDVKHTIVYLFGGLTGSVAVQSSALSLSWQVPYEFIYEIPTGSSHGTCWLNIHTYDKDGNVIGVTTTSFIARMDVNKEAPTFNPIIKDTYSKTLALTGDENIFVRYYSNAYVDVGAVGKLGATIISKEVRCGGQRSLVSPTVLYEVESAEFELTATDSRKATAKTVINKILIPYTKISCNVFDLNLTTDGTLTFTVQGNYFNDSFGASNNSLTLKYRINDGAYVIVNRSNIEIEGHNFNTNITVNGLQYNEIYTVEAIATDKLSSAGEGETYNITGEPLFDWGKNDFNFNIPVIIQGRQVFGDNTILWSGSSSMGSSDSIELSEEISKQPNGIVLVFSGWDGTGDYYWNTSFVPKGAISFNGNDSSYRHTCFMTAGESIINCGIKTLFIRDKEISGTSGNLSSATIGGITQSNDRYSLTYVIGV